MEIVFFLDWRSWSCLSVLSDFLVFTGRPVRIRWPEMASKFAEIGDRSISEILRGGSVSSSHIGASPSCPKIARFPKVVRFPAQAKINWPLQLLHLPDSSKDSPFLLASLGHREMESAYWKGNLGTKSDKSAWNASDRALILSDRFVWDMIRRSPSLCRLQFRSSLKITRCLRWKKKILRSLFIHFRSLSHQDRSLSSKIHCCDFNKYQNIKRLKGALIQILKLIVQTLELNLDGWWVCVFWIAITDQGKWLLRAARNPLNDSNSDVMAAKLINKFHLNPGWSHEYIKYMWIY